MAEIYIDPENARSKIKDFGRVGSQSIERMDLTGTQSKLPTAEACLQAAMDLRTVLLYYQGLIKADCQKMLDFVANHEKADQA